MSPRISTPLYRPAVRPYQQRGVPLKETSYRLFDLRMLGDGIVTMPASGRMVIEKAWIDSVSLPARSPFVLSHTNTQWTITAPAHHPTKIVGPTLLTVRFTDDKEVQTLRVPIRQQH